MRKTISNSKLTTLPKFNDGLLTIYKKEQIKENHYPKDYLINTGVTLTFENKGISDRKRFDFEERNLEIKKRIAIPSYSEIDSMKIVKIENDFFEVFNNYEYADKEGYLKNDLTLISYRGLIPDERD